MSRPRMCVVHLLLALFSSSLSVAALSIGSVARSKELRRTSAASNVPYAGKMTNAPLTGAEAKNSDRGQRRLVSLLERRCLCRRGNGKSPMRRMTKHDLRRLVGLGFLLGGAGFIAWQTATQHASQDVCFRSSAPFKHQTASLKVREGGGLPHGPPPSRTVMYPRTQETFGVQQPPQHACRIAPKFPAGVKVVATAGEEAGQHGGGQAQGLVVYPSVLFPDAADQGFLGSLKAAPGNWEDSGRYWDPDYCEKADHKDDCTEKGAWRYDGSHDSVWRRDRVVKKDTGVI